MPRNKHPEQTEARILEAATRLFLEKGYRDTSIQDIVDELGGMTRGAFYHHFKSKEDIFDKVITELFEQEHLLEHSMETTGTTALEKLRNLVLRSTDSEVQRKILRSGGEFFSSDKFLAMQLRDVVAQVAPLVTPLMEEGIADGSMSVAHPRAAAELFLLSVNIWLNPLIYPADEERFFARVETFGQALRGMGVPLLNEEIRAALRRFYRNIASDGELPSP